MTCKILLTFKYRNHRDEVSEHTLTFLSVPDFKNYLRWQPDKAMMIGYGPVISDVVEKSRTSDVRLAIALDDYRVELKDAHAFADYLKRNKEVAKALQFTSI